MRHMATREKKFNVNIYPETNFDCILFLAVGDELIHIVL